MGFFSDLGSSISNTFSSFTTSLSNFGSNLLSLGRSIFQSGSEFVQSGYDAVADFFTSPADSLKSAYTDYVAPAVNFLGESFGQAGGLAMDYLKSSAGPLLLAGGAALALGGSSAVLPVLKNVIGNTALEFATGKIMDAVKVSIGGGDQGGYQPNQGYNSIAPGEWDWMGGSGTSPGRGVAEAIGDFTRGDKVGAVTGLLGGLLGGLGTGGASSQYEGTPGFNPTGGGGYGVQVGGGGQSLPPWVMQENPNAGGGGGFLESILGTVSGQPEGGQGIDWGQNVAGAVQGYADAEMLEDMAKLKGKLDREYLGASAAAQEGLKASYDPSGYNAAAPEAGTNAQFAALRARQNAIQKGNSLPQFQYISPEEIARRRQMIVGG